MNIRFPAVAGSFYPANQQELSQTIQGLLKKAADSTDKLILPPGRLAALIVPHAGYFYSGLVAASGYRLIQTENFRRPPKILLLGPAHQTAFTGLAASSAIRWQTPLGLVNVDPLNSKVKAVDLAHQDEHSLEVQLPFLQSVLPDFRIIPLLTGEGEIADFTTSLQPFLANIDLFLVSSDLSHYLTYTQANEVDRRTNSLIASLDVENSGLIDACGKTAIITLMQIAKEQNWQGVLIDYQNSGDTAGDKNAVVGYSCHAFYER